MPSTETTKTVAVTLELLQERSREALIDRLGLTLDGLEPHDLHAFIADLLLTAGADRDRLKSQLAQLLASRFGQRSEKSSKDQLDLFAEILRVFSETKSGEASSDEPGADKAPSAAAAALIAQTDADVEREAAEARALRKAEREVRHAAAKLERANNDDAPRWPEHLPVRHETIDPSEPLQRCDDCGEPRKVLRHEVSWRMEYRTTAEVVVTHLPVLACPSHHGGPVQEPVPPKPVDKGQLGFSLAARIIWYRTTHNLPVRRIAEMLHAQRVPVSEQMIHTLLVTSGERAQPLVNALRAGVQAAALVNIDDTFTNVLEGQTERRRRRAHVWLALGDQRLAFFFATKTWRASEAGAALGPITGVLQGDGYKGFPSYTKKSRIQLAGCMDHLRRKLRAAVLAKDPRATEAMAYVQGMYRVEELARLRHLDADQRLVLRQERTLPMMQALIAWARRMQPTIVKGSPLGQAWTYLSNQLQPLQLFLSNGVVEISNASAERGLRRVTIGRKLWLFHRGHEKLEHICRLMSLVVTARLHGVNELDYLEWVLEQLARREWSDTAAAALLPAAWLVSQEQRAE